MFVGVTVVGDVNERRLEGLTLSIPGQNAEGKPSTETVLPLNMDKPGSLGLLP